MEESDDNVLSSVTLPTFGSVAESNLTELEYVGEERAAALYDAGFESIEHVATANVKELGDVDDVPLPLAGRIHKEARDRVTE